MSRNNLQAFICIVIEEVNNAGNVEFPR